MLGIPTVRAATTHDLQKIRVLLPAPTSQVLEALSESHEHPQRYVLVADPGDGTLAAVALVTLKPPQAHLELLVMEERHASRELETRILAVSEALAAAFDCVSLDVPLGRAA